MSDEREFRVRPGRVRSTRSQALRPFIAQALAAAQKAGGRVSRSGRVRSGDRSQFGRGRVASIQANRLLAGRSRVAIIKTRVVRHSRHATPLAAHLDYLKREGVTRDGTGARMFGAEVDDASIKDFAERCNDDRHHFRFIVSPEDAVDMTDLKSFTRDLMGRVAKDLGTSLDWVAVDHWNTDNPHVHVILRGRADDGQDLVISRDYISHGMRGRARDLITRELGPRSDLDIHRHVGRQVEAEHWTQLDRQLVRDAGEPGIIDVAPHADRQPDEFNAFKIGRLRKLETLGLADQVGPGQWIVSDRAEATLRELGDRGDIIKRMHRVLSGQGFERASASYVLAAETIDGPILGRLLERGLDDELRGTAYAVIDGVDGRCHHIRLPDLEAAGDGAPGSIVELRKFDDTQGRRRLALAVRSDLDVESQVVADGATWLDRQALARSASLSEAGFGADVRHAMGRRAEHLVGLGLAERRAGGIVFAGNFLETLRRRELDALGNRLASRSGQSFKRAASGEFVEGIYNRRFALASGRFAMIDDGLGFQLVPWTPSLERHLGNRISGVVRSDGGIDWSFSRKRGLGL